jgi:hypothetical protein
MDTKKAAAQSATSPTAEDKLRALGASPAKKEDPLASAKASFNAALAKTREQDGGEDVEEKVTILEQPKKGAIAKPKAEVVVEPPKPDNSAELAELRSQIAELKSAREPKQAEKPAEPQTSDYDSIQAQLQEEFGDDEGAVLGKALRALLQPREDRLSRLEKMLTTAIEKSNIKSSKDNRSRLAENYGQLKSQEAWDVVKDRVESLMSKSPDKYDSQADAYDAVAKALYGEPGAAAEATANEAAELEASRIAASLPTPPKANKSEAKVTGVQRSRAIFDHLFKNPEDVAGAKKMARKLQVEE